MIRQLLKSKRKRILIDIDTQKDLLFADGAACTRNHRRVIANIRRMMAWARHNNVPVISTSQVNPNHNGHSPFKYCIEGTEGQQKISYTILRKHITFDADGNLDLPFDILRRYNQVILDKRAIDPFVEPRIERLLTELMSSEFIVIGSIAEDSVLSAVLGLLHRGKNVTVVTDAVGSHNTKKAEMAIRKMKAKGARIVESRKFAGSSGLRSVHACHCKTCQRQTQKPHIHMAV